VSWDKFEDECAACKPVLLDLETRHVLPADSPEMLAVDKVWARTTHAEREAFHRVTCLNSRVVEDLQVVQELSEKMSRAMDEDES